MPEAVAVVKRREEAANAATVLAPLVRGSPLEKSVVGRTSAPKMDTGKRLKTIQDQIKKTQEAFTSITTDEDINGEHVQIANHMSINVHKLVHALSPHLTAEERKNLNALLNNLENTISTKANELGLSTNKVDVTKDTLDMKPLLNCKDSEVDGHVNSLVNRYKEISTNLHGVSEKRKIDDLVDNYLNFSDILKGIREDFKQNIVAGTAETQIPGSIGQSSPTQASVIRIPEITEQEARATKEEKAKVKKQRNWQLDFKGEWEILKDNMKKLFATKSETKQDKSVIATAYEATLERLNLLKEMIDSINAGSKIDVEQFNIEWLIANKTAMELSKNLSDRKLRKNLEDTRFYIKAHIEKEVHSTVTDIPFTFNFDSDANVIASMDEYAKRIPKMTVITGGGIQGISILGSWSLDAVSSKINDYVSQKLS